LIYATQNGNFAVITSLDFKYIDVQIIDKKEKNAVLHTCEHGCFEIVQYLLTRSKMNALILDNGGVLTHAAR
jgi:ankyrin repeat protein